MYYQHIRQRLRSTRTNLCILLSKLYQAKPDFMTPQICFDDPASLRPLDRESTATAELVPGAPLDYYTGGTTNPC